MSITQKQIADHVGVDRTAVSRALAGKGRELGLSDACIRSIRQTARELGYRPNRFAQGMRRGAFGAYGLVNSTISSAATIAEGTFFAIQRGILSRDLHLIVGQLPDEQLTDKDALPRLLREWAVDGLLISYTAKAPQQMIKILQERHMPAIWINSKLDRDCVYPNDYEGGCMAAKTLIDAGHRRLGWLETVSTKHYSLADRREGFFQTARAAGLQPQTLPGLDLPEGANRIEALAEVFRGADRPTGVSGYCSKCIQSMLLAARGICRIPEQLSVVGIDQSPVAPYCEPPVTQIGAWAYRVGERAMELLEQRIAAPDQPLPPEPVPCRFKAGATVAPPPAGSTTN